VGARGYVVVTVVLITSRPSCFRPLVEDVRPVGRQRDKDVGAHGERRGPLTTARSGSVGPVQAQVEHRIGPALDEVHGRAPWSFFIILTSCGRMPATAPAASTPATAAGSRFIAGAPMKRATNVLAGVA
jgi:hypothetical protein